MAKSVCCSKRSATPGRGCICKFSNCRPCLAIIKLCKALPTGHLWPTRNLLRRASTAAFYIPASRSAGMSAIALPNRPQGLHLYIFDDQRLHHAFIWHVHGEHWGVNFGLTSAWLLFSNLNYLSAMGRAGELQLCLTFGSQDRKPFSWNLDPRKSHTGILRNVKEQASAGAAAVLTDMVRRFQWTRLIDLSGFCSQQTP